MYTYNCTCKCTCFSLMVSFLLLISAFISANSYKTNKAEKYHQMIHIYVRAVELKSGHPRNGRK